ncbi:hypothetical protein CTAYLR_005685 [Chrysophaeum taylorii]|uniref:SnoaL-like domain-containing protein n=1 Tax=Chrysophaeum taylorii TaxID=2483200 RepID=A0AAD7ULA9_9STRA|nr:hypothetical protein CTAYLR_005685 [Chrysophaeum taylorii]
MGRSVRTWKKSKESKQEADTTKELHGYRGRLYSLVAKKQVAAEGAAAAKGDEPSPASPEQQPSRPQSPTQPLANALELADQGAKRREPARLAGERHLESPRSQPPTSPRPPETSPPTPLPAAAAAGHAPGSSPPFLHGLRRRSAESSEEGKQQQQQQQQAAAGAGIGREHGILLGPGSEAGDIVVNGNLRVRDIVADGDLRDVRHGPRQADYAEFFKWDPAYLPDDDEAAVSEDIVQLRSPNQTLTLDTTGDGPCLVVSTSPSVAAGVPVDPAQAEQGALVAFSARSPLVPSGDCDGCAVARDDASEEELLLGVVGVAMEAADDDASDDNLEHRVLCLVRWDVAVKRKVCEMVDETLVAVRTSTVRVATKIGLLATYAWLGIEILWITLLVAGDLPGLSLIVPWAEDPLVSARLFLALLARRPSSSASSSALAPDVSQRIRALQEQQRTIADELASLQVVTPRTQILRLYEAFNARDLEGVASLLADDVVYEDLLLGDTTICRGKEAFKAALAWHPAFVSARLDLPLGSLELVVDKVACDGDTTVAVEWHVEQNGRPFPLGRGLSIATLDDDKNLSRVVDLCEAPWRVVGLLVRPVLFSARPRR